MKICLVNTNEFLGGAAIACQRLKSSLEKVEGVEVQIINLKIDSFFSKYKFLFFLLVEKLYLLWHIKDKNEKFKISLPLFGVSLSQKKAIIEADIVHLHWINQGFLSIRSLRTLFNLKKNIVWTLHDMWPLTAICHHSRDCNHFHHGCGNCFYLKNPNANDLSKKYFDLKKYTYNLSNIYPVACSHWLGIHAKSSSIWKPEEVNVIPNPIDTSLFKPQDKNTLRQKYGLKSDTKYILFVSANVNDHRKGFDYLFKSLKLLPPNHGYELLIVGDVKSSIGQIDIPYKSFGYVKDMNIMSELYALADVFVIPSLEENLPNTIMESISCGTPVVAFNVGGIPDMVIHLFTGYLAEYKNAEDFKNGMLKILNLSDNEYQNISKNCREKVLNNFSSEIISDRYLNLYKKILQ